MLGIDFGTSSTVAVVKLDDGRTVPLLFGETPLLPSAVCVTPGSELLVGRDAIQASRSRPEAFEAHPKSRIDDGEVLLGDQAVPVAELIGAVLRRVHDEAVRVAGAAVGRLVLTHPAGWGARRRRTLREAATVAGLPTAVLVAEPVAAAAYYVHVLGHAVPPGGLLVVYDFGAGTFDASVVRRTGDGFEVLAEAGILDAGGLDIDAAIVAHLGAVHGVSDPEGWRRLTAPTTPADRRMSRTFWDDVRIAKETLSRTSTTTIFAPILERDAVLGREQLEHLARPLLDRTVAATRLAVRNAGISTKEIAAVFLVGGSSRMPLSATLLHRSLEIPPTVIEQPELIVAGGTLHVHGADPRTAEPPLQNKAPTSVPQEASPLAVVQQPTPPTPVLPDPPAPTSPVTVSPAPSSPAYTLPHTSVHAGHQPGGRDGLSAGRPVQTAAPIAPSHADQGQPRTTVEVTGPTAPARRRRRLLAIVATAVAVIIIVVVVAIARQSEPPATDPTLTKSSGNALTNPAESSTASATITPTINPTRLATLTGHKDSVWSVAFSPDGKTMATASRDKTVMVWNVANPATPTPITTLTGHKDFVQSVAFSPDGKTMATASSDTLMVWNVANPAVPTPMATLTDHKDSVGSVAFSPDGKTMATASADKTVMVWNVANPATPTHITTLTDHKAWVPSVAFSPDGKTMATASADKTVMVWNVANPATPTRITTLTGHNDSVWSVAFSPDGKTMATASADKTVMVWNVANPATPTRITTLTGHNDSVWSVAFSPDGKTMATASRDKTVMVWNVANPATPTRITTLTDHTDSVGSVAFSPDGKTMATTSDDDTAIVWRLTAT
ncbi:Hsp70 family protein [Dactylosporangium sp. CA-233914]|uniref:Hsp70 family protein n=1 Tax=Dactylosporangium sp. CA-233914 TaxID=3239934 RepID=UPI003D912573